jgi:hypothetical protein
LARGVQQAGAGWNQALPAGGLENHPVPGRLFSWRKTAIPGGEGGEVR